MVAREAGFVGTISKTRIFEGDRNRIIGADGKIIQNKPFHEETTTFQIPFQLMDEIGPEQIQKKLSEMAKEIGTGQKKYFYETINKIINAAGTAVEAKEAKFNIELFLQGIETIDLEFNSNWEPLFPTFIIHPDMQKLANEELKKLEENKEIKEKFNSIIRKKRDEWIVRENNRQLVG